MYIQLSPLVSGMVRESLKSSLQRSCCGEVRCEKEKNFCVDNFSELAHSCSIFAQHGPGQAGYISDHLVNSGEKKGKKKRKNNKLATLTLYYQKE